MPAPIFFAADFQLSVERARGRGRLQQNFGVQAEGGRRSAWVTFELDSITVPLACKLRLSLCRNAGNFRYSLPGGNR